MQIELQKKGENMNFKDLNIIEPILKAIEEKGYKSPSSIQEKAITPILEGKDLLGCAQTGTGKTAAFAIPLLQKLYNSERETPRKIKALILTPTRELAIQIRDEFRDYGKYTDLRCSVIFGGVNQKSQVEVLKKGIDILVATPGRLLDLIAQKHAKLGDVDYLVLDEADSMLDMGFIYDVNRVISHLPKSKQTLLFSATMPAEIDELAKTYLNDPTKVIVSPVASTGDKVEQLIYYVDKGNKSNLLLDIFKKNEMGSTLIFTRTKHGANKLSDILRKNNIQCAAIHGNKSQTARQQALSSFKSGEINVLVATDIAARGIDIKELAHVVNYEVPNVAETYVHRIGRTARAGKGGCAISLCDFDEIAYIRGIEKLINKKITEIKDHPFPMLILQYTPTPEKTNRFTSRKSTLKTEKPAKAGLDKFSKNSSKKNNRYSKYANNNKKSFQSGKTPKLYKQSRNK
jgi:ATP-dependent RNA helicase RhlE